MACFTKSAQPGGKNSINLADCLTLSPGKTVKSVYEKPSDLVNILVPNLFTLAGVFLFAMIIFAGIKFITGGAKAKDDAKNIIQTVIVGFLVMFAAYWVVRIIEMLTGAEILL